MVVKSQTPGFEPELCHTSYLPSPRFNFFINKMKDNVGPLPLKFLLNGVNICNMLSIIPCT